MNLLKNTPIVGNMKSHKTIDILDTKIVLTPYKFSYDSFSDVPCKVSLTTLMLDEDMNLNGYGVITENVINKFTRSDITNEIAFLRKAVIKFCEEKDLTIYHEINSWPWCKVIISLKNLK